MQALAAALREILDGPVLVGEPLRRHTTWRIGGPASLFIAPRSEVELVAALALLDSTRTPWLALGAGSNLLVRDGGFRGAVIHTGALRELTFQDDGSVRAGAGLPMMRLIREAAARDLAGLEELAGIPATVGGAVAMNAGAGDQDMAGVLEGVFLAGPDGIAYRPVAGLDMGYRASALPCDRIVTTALLRFRRGEAAALAESIRQGVERRRRSQGVGRPNAGSVFKNPPGQHAWRLIDKAGMRGYRIGGAEVSKKHANFIVNRGDARAADVLALIAEVQRAVRERTGILLEPEVVTVGEA